MSLHESITYLAVLLTISHTIRITLDFQVIGVYTICYGEKADNMSIAAKKFNESFVFMQQVMENLYPYHKNLELKYSSFDVCYNTTSLTSLMTDLLLDPEYVFMEEPEKQIDKTVTNWKYQTRILAIAAMLPASMINVMASVLSNTKIPIHVYTSDHKMSRDLFASYPNLIRTDSNINNLRDHFTLQNNNFFKEFKVKDVLLVRLSMSSRIHEVKGMMQVFWKETEKLYSALLKETEQYVLESGNICLKKMVIPVDSKNFINDTSAEYLSELSFKKKQFIFTFGEPDQQVEFIDFVNNKSEVPFQKDNIAILTTDAASLRKLSNIKGKVDIPVVDMFNSVRASVRIEPWLDRLNAIFWNLFWKRGDDNVLATYREFVNTLSMGKLPPSLINNIEILWRKNLKQIGLNSMETDAAFDVKKFLQLNLLYDLDVFQENVSILFGTNGSINDIDFSTNCIHPVCPPGFEKLYGKIPPNSTIYILKEEYGFKCVKCTPGLVKKTFGNERCHPCQGILIPNDKQTNCFDPYATVMLNIESVPGLIAIAISASGLFLTVLTIFTFCRFRNSIIVKMSDKVLSFIQLFSIAALFCSLPIVYFAEPSTLSCSIRSVSIAIFYTINFSVVLVKSNKLVQAFKSKVRRNRREVLMTYYYQYLIIITNVAIANAMLVILWNNKLPDFVFIRESQRFKVFFYCNNDQSNTASITFVLMIKCSCMFQAYRCRKLPGYVNEAMNIVYLSFVTLVSGSVMYPIFHFQENELDGSMVHLLILLGENTVLLLFLYSGKVFVMIFKPNKNTKEYFRNRQREVVEMQARELNMSS